MHLLQPESPPDKNTPCAFCPLTASPLSSGPPSRQAFTRLSLLEGIIPAIETSHALAYLEKLCPTVPHGTRIVINLSGRGDKDVNTAIKYLGM